MHFETHEGETLVARFRCKDASATKKCFEQLHQKVDAQLWGAPCLLGQWTEAVAAEGGFEQRNEQREVFAEVFDACTQQVFSL